MATPIKAFVVALAALLTSCSEPTSAFELRSGSAVDFGLEAEEVASADYDYGGEVGGEVEAEPAEASGGRADGERFLIPNYWLPVPYQYDAGSCLFMTATGIAEWLYRRATGSALDLSERYTITVYNLHKEALRQATPNFRLYNDLPLVYKLVDHYVLDASIKFTTERVGRRFSARVNWKIIDDGRVAKSSTAVFDRMRRDVIFRAEERVDSQLQYGIMTDDDVEAIKDALRDKQSPVLLTYHPKTANWWHANMIVGFDEARQVFLTRDSAFGKGRMDHAKYTYGTSYAEDDKAPVDLYEMSFDKVKAQGNHAAVYYLAD